MNNLLDRLIRVEWSIQIQTRIRGKLIKDVLLDVKLEDLLKIIIPNEDDPLLYDGYDLDKEKIKYLNNFTKDNVKIDFRRYCYFLVCGGIYEKDKV
jgi:hypothetical protein